MKNLVSIVLLALACGCVPFHRGGTTHYLVLGFGLVSVNSTNQIAVTAVKANVLGVMASTMPGPKLSVGYTSMAAASVETNQNAIVEIGGLGKSVNITTFK
jgi:hypothetical protein